MDIEMSTSQHSPNKIGRNELQIRKNLQKGTRTKMAEKLVIGSIDNRYTKLGKTIENLLLSQGLFYLKIHHATF